MKNLNDLEDSALLTTCQASEYLPYTKGSLCVMRQQGKGPIHTKIGGRVYYKPIHLKAFLNGEDRTSTKG